MKLVRSSFPISSWCAWLNLLLALSPAVGFAQYRMGTDERLDPAGIRGSLVICGGGRLPAAAREQFLKLAGVEKGQLIVIPTAREDADQVTPEVGLKPWNDAKLESVALLHTRSRDEANTEAIFGPLKSATAVWFDGGSQSRIADAYLGTAVEHELSELLKRGGVIGGTSAGAAIMCRVMIAQGNPLADIKTGFDLLPGCVIDQHFSERRRQPRLFGVIAKHPQLVGIGIDEDTALIVRGRNMEVVGKGRTTICLAKSVSRPEREIVFKSGEQTDLTRWRLAARARTMPEFPTRQNATSNVPKGSLVIVGGGRMPREVAQKFIDLAGGPESTIVVLPTANPDPLPSPPQEGRFLERLGAKKVVTLPDRTLQGVSDPEFLNALKEAKGIWFGGGRQWRFMDAYAETPAAEAIRAVLERGGVIGGSSAGATIQGEYLVRGSPQGNFEMMAEGYERGMNFLPGVAIDQHFKQRNRLPDMLGVMYEHPQLLGIGLDEGTAIIVQGHTAEVMGLGEAHFFDTHRQFDDEDLAPISLKPGQRYDLMGRRESSR